MKTVIQSFPNMQIRFHAQAYKLTVDVNNGAKINIAYCTGQQIATSSLAAGKRCSGAVQYRPRSLLKLLSELLKMSTHNL